MTAPTPEEVARTASAIVRGVAFDVFAGGSPAACAYARNDLRHAIAQAIAAAREDGAREVRASREELRRLHTEAMAHAEALEQKLATLCKRPTCACSYDNPNDVCLWHSPLLIAAQARADAAEQRERGLRALIRECRLADAHAARTGDEGRWDRAFDALCRAEREAALTDTRHPETAQAGEVSGG